MHINSNDLNNFQNEEMNTDEIIAFLEHMNHCDYLTSLRTNIQIMHPQLPPI